MGAPLVLALRAKRLGEVRRCVVRGWIEGQASSQTFRGFGELANLHIFRAQVTPGHGALGRNQGCHPKSLDGLLKLPLFV